MCTFTLKPDLQIKVWERLNIFSKVTQVRRCGTYLVWGHFMMPD